MQYDAVGCGYIYSTNITQYKVLDHIIKRYHTKLQYFALKHILNTLNNNNIILHITK